MVMQESKYNILLQNCLVVRHLVHYIYFSPDPSINQILKMGAVTIVTSDRGPNDDE